MPRALEAKMRRQGNLRAAERDKIEEARLGRRGSLVEEKKEVEDETLDTERNMGYGGEAERSNIVC